MYHYIPLYHHTPPNISVTRLTELCFNIILQYAKLYVINLSPQIFFHTVLIHTQRGWHYPANTSRWINVGLMLVNRLRRWTNVKPIVTQRLMPAGYQPLWVWINIYQQQHARDNTHVGHCGFWHKCGSCYSSNNCAVIDLRNTLRSCN